MRVIVDTSVWSLALRRKNKVENSSVMLFRHLIIGGRVALLGMVRQEILSGIRHVEQFEKLKDYLHAFPDLQLEAADHELAAEYLNICRNKGVQGANTDFLICAAAHRRRYGILTTDKDFETFSQYLPVVLLET